MLLKAKNLSHSAGNKTLFRDLELAMNQGDRLGLVGHNGSGKSIRQAGYPLIVRTLVVAHRTRPP